MTTHPDFARAPKRHRWTGTLAALFAELRRRAGEADGGWAWAVLPHGALVSMRVRPDGRRELRIARSQPPPDRARGKWDREVETFVRHFGVEAWDRWPDAQATGVAVVFTAPAASGPEAYGLFPETETKRRPRSALER